MKDKTVSIIVAIAVVIIAIVILRRIGDLVFWVIAIVLAFLVYRNWAKIKKALNKI